MNRRKLLTGVATAGIVSVAGCAGGTTDDETEDTEQEEENTIERNGEQYFFQDTTGTMGQLGEQTPPAETQDWQVIQNQLTEEQWQEKQINDVENTRRLTKNVSGTNHTGLDMTVEEMLERAEEIYRNQQFNTVEGIPDVENEDDEITFTRSLIKASQEAGVDSSGLADDIVSNMVEYAEQELDIVDFNNYKLSTLPSTEQLNIGDAPDSIKGSPKNGVQNSGFGHMPALLQYNKNGKTEVKYTEMTRATFAGKFWRSIRDPEESKYRSSLENDIIKHEDETKANGGFPEHFVTALDYSKVRELELRNEDILGFGPNDGPADNDYESLGDEIGQFLTELVDDYYFSGIMGQSPDMNIREDVQVGRTLVSDEFGESLEEYVVDPDPETRDHVENIGRGIHTIRQEQGWDTDLALTGTIDNPEIRGTTRDRINEIRADQAFDQIRERVAE